jgi:hypothetical protein
MKRSALPLAILCLVLLAGAWRSSPATQSVDGINRVYVTNFPDPMHVDGEVSLKQAFIRTDETLVAPARLDEPTQMVRAGTLETQGFRTVVVGLSGEVKGQLASPGRVGAILIPNQETAIQAFEQRGQLIFPLQTTTPDLAAGTQYFGSEITEFTVAFPSYRIYLFNSTEEIVSAEFFAYLSTS